MPDLICVADVGVWRSFKMVIHPLLQHCSKDEEKNKEAGLDRLTVRSGYMESTSDSEVYTPVGAMIFDTLEELAWKYPGMRTICDYMRTLGVEGTGEGRMKFWNPEEVLTKDVLGKIQFLNTGRFWDKWSMMIQ